MHRTRRRAQASGDRTRRCTQGPARSAKEGTRVRRESHCRLARRRSEIHGASSNRDSALPAVAGVGGPRRRTVGIVGRPCSATRPAGRQSWRVREVQIRPDKRQSAARFECRCHEFARHRPRKPVRDAAVVGDEVESLSSNRLEMVEARRSGERHRGVFILVVKRRRIHGSRLVHVLLVLKRVSPPFITRVALRPPLQHEQSGCGQLRGYSGISFNRSPSVTTFAAAAAALCASSLRGLRSTCGIGELLARSRRGLSPRQSRARAGASRSLNSLSEPRDADARRRPPSPRLPRSPYRLHGATTTMRKFSDTLNSMLDALVDPTRPRRVAR